MTIIYDPGQIQRPTSREIELNFRSGKRVPKMGFVFMCEEINEELIILIREWVKSK